MDGDLKKIKKLVSFMRKAGVLQLKQEGIELSISPQALFPETKPKKTDSAVSSSPEDQANQELSNLLWSAPGYVPGAEKV